MAADKGSPALTLLRAGGEVVGGAPLTFAPPPAPEPSRGAAALRAKASKSVVDEARAIQSPATKKALRDAGVLQ
jgi:hypothetical protein